MQAAPGVRQWAYRLGLAIPRRNNSLLIPSLGMLLCGSSFFLVNEPADARHETG